MMLFKVLKMTVALYILVLFKSQSKMMYKMEAIVNIFQNYGNVIPLSHFLDACSYTCFIKYAYYLSGVCCESSKHRVRNISIFNS